MSFFPGRILLIDDDTDVRNSLRRLLEEEGYVVSEATSHAEALTRLDEGGWDVALIDRRLQGPAGPDEGLGLIAEIDRRSPGAKAIIVTGYADADAIERAFVGGAYDFLEKDAKLIPMLKAKVRNAVEARQARLLVGLDSAAREARLRDVWAAARTETDANRKGRYLERALALLFSSVEGFQVVDTNLRTEQEEIDIFLRNASGDPFWQKEPPYVLVECKNWSRALGIEHYSHFRRKLKNRYGRGKLGVLVAMNGFTGPLRTEQLTDRAGDLLILLLTGEDLAAWIGADDRGGWLQRRHADAVAARAVR